MDIFQRHEAFEIEILDRMNSANLLEPLVFGGGTMLRLCHELNRYSVDLDFWFIKEKPQSAFFDHLRIELAKHHEITDAQIKHHTLRFELRSGLYPRRLKIEIRRKMQEWDVEKAIAFSRWSNRQVFVMAHTLKQTMHNKIEAFIDRGEIRDCFDMEFLMRRGVNLPIGIGELVPELKKRIAAFRDLDFKVKLGSILEKSYRDYYIENRFRFLERKLDSVVFE